MKWIESLQLNYESFPEEPITDDGTIAHALERIFMYGCQSKGMDAHYIAPLPDHLPRVNGGGPDITVIVPCLNALPWLNHCLQSCLTQSSASLSTEIIIVDNGSTDGSLEYAAAIAQAHDTVTLLHAAEKSAGAARNFGLHHASGRYITFLDADDVLLPTALTELMDVIRLADADEPLPEVVVSSLMMFSEDGHTVAMPHEDHGHVMRVSKGITESSLNVWGKLFSDFGPCGKLYSRKFLQENNISFPNCAFEDNLFIYHALFAAREITVLSRCTYLYRKYLSRHGQTESTRLSGSALNDQLLVCELIAKKLDLLKAVPLKVIAVRNLLHKLVSEASRIGYSGEFVEALQNSAALMEAARSFRLIDCLSPLGITTSQLEFV